MSARLTRIEVRKLRRPTFVAQPVDGIARAKSRREQPEAAIHRAIIAQLRARAWPDVLYWHTPNGGLRNKRSAALLKALGVLPGVFDILAMQRGYFFALEVKAPGGRLTEHQQDFQERFSAAGGFCCVVDSIDRAIKVLESWKLLRGVAA